MEGEEQPKQPPQNVEDLVEKIVGSKHKRAFKTVTPVVEQQVTEVEDVKPLMLVPATQPYKSKINSEHLREALGKQMKEQQEREAKEQASRAEFQEKLKRKRQDKLETASKMKLLPPEKITEISTKGEKADPIEIEDD